MHIWNALKWQLYVLEQNSQCSIIGKDEKSESNLIILEQTATKNMGALEARLIKYFCHEHAIIIEKRCTSVSMRCRLFDRFVRFGTSAPTVLLVVKFSCFVMDNQSFTFMHRTWYMKQKCDFKSKFYRTSLQTSKCILVNVQTKY